MKKLVLTSTVALALFLAGCSQNNGLIYTKTSYKSKGLCDIATSDVYINYGAVTDEAVKTIFQSTKIPKRVIVTDFVDITSLQNNSKLGYVLSNNIKNSLINHFKINVVEAEVSKYFRISGNGLKILSRNIDKLRARNFQVEYAIVGTYTHTDKELVIFVKLIDLKTGIIKGSYAKVFPMGIGTKMMLDEK